MKNLITLIALILAPAICHGQEADYQTRILIHKQFTQKATKIGIAGWSIIPDASTVNPLRWLIVCGPMYKDSSQWLELMVGVMTNGMTNIEKEKGDAMDFIFDVRSKKDFSKGEIAFETFFRKKRSAFISSASYYITKSKKLVVACGVESDYFFTKSDVRYGPRFMITIHPITFIQTYHFKQGGDIVRTYIVVNL